MTHIYFVRARKAQNVPNESMPYISPFGIWGSYIALGFCILIAFTKNFPVFTHDEDYGDFDYKNFITGYLGIPLYLIMIFGWKFYHKTQGVQPKTADLWTGKDEIDREEQEFLAQQAAKRKHPNERGFYERFVSWLF